MSSTRLGTKHPFLPVLPDTPLHACCTTCTTKKHISQCVKVCDSCDETKDLEHVYVLSPHSSLSNDTSPAMLYALPPQWQESTASTDTRDVGEGGEAEDAHRPVRGATQSTAPAQIFLDSGCIAGNYIREDLANKLVKKLPHFILMQLQMCVVLLVNAN